MEHRGAMVPVTDGINNFEHWTARRCRFRYLQWRNVDTERNVGDSSSSSSSSFSSSSLSSSSSSNSHDAANSIEEDEDKEDELPTFISVSTLRHCK